MSCIKGQRSQESQESREVEKQMLQRRKEIEKEVKILILGTGGSGKSTFLKQMKFMTADFTNDELESYKKVIWNNIIESVKILVTPSQNEDKQGEDDLLGQLEQEKDIMAKIGLCEAILKNKRVASRFSLRKSLNLKLVGSSDQLLEDLERIKQPNYVPSKQDVFLARERTNGIHEFPMHLKKEDANLRFFDVGGQRNERKKWIQCFDDVSAIIFVASLTEYDESLEEDSSTSAVDETLEVWSKVVNDWFPNTPIILFMNKTDLFKEKLMLQDLSAKWKDYTGGKDTGAAGKFYIKKFHDLDKNAKNRKIYTHYTQATDTNNIQKVFGDCKKIFLEAALKSSGLK